MKKLILLFILSFFMFPAVFSQGRQYVQWGFSQKKISNDEVELSFKAKIDKTWHLYSQVEAPKGPTPTSFTFEKSKDYKLIGNTSEPKPHKIKEPMFDDMTVRYFENSAEFTQKIKVLEDKSVQVKGYIEGMACNDRVCQNIAPPVDFNFNLSDAEVSAPAKKTEELKSIFSLKTEASNQNKQYVTWTFSQKKIGDGEFELTFKAKIEPSWHLYSQIESVDGPLPTIFEFEKSKDFKLIGKTIEPKPIEHAEPVFDNQIMRYFEKSATFKQKIKVLSDKPFVVKGFIDGMACNETQCQKFSPPVDFKFSISDVSGIKGAASAAVDSLNKVLQPADTSKGVAEHGGTSALTIEKQDKTPEFVQAPSTPKADRTLVGLFIAGFLGGLLALLTPCVFPMLPMTVSFFTKQSKTKAAGIRNALIYAISIIVIYIALGLGVTLLFGADALNNMATNVWFNLAFFVLLVVFAISFLGAFEITLPSSFVNKMDAKSDKGGLIGIFFMAFTLSLVSFSCTGPIIGTLLVEAASTGALAAPFVGMFGFSLALALPFSLFAAFPGWLNSLPKSGGWLNSVKVVLGFLELALALKFLSNADLVVQAHYVSRELFIVIWIVIFALLGAYLMGWFKLSHDSDMKYVSVGRLMMAILSFAFTVYLIPGLWGAPLKLISGFPPPDFYSESPEGFGGRKAEMQMANEKHTDMPEHAHRGPNGIPAFDDYYLALAYAKTVNKPLMLDFTGWACVNCRKMEGQVWSDSDVKRKLSEEFVLVSLYVDDKKKLPEELQTEVVWSGSTRRLRSVGDRWSYLQNTRYQSSTQPQYWIIDADENHFSDSTSYDPDIAKYIMWLDKGLEKYKAKHPSDE